MSPLETLVKEIREHNAVVTGLHRELETLDVRRGEIATTLETVAGRRYLLDEALKLIIADPAHTVESALKTIADRQQVVA